MKLDVRNPRTGQADARIDSNPEAVSACIARMRPMQARWAALPLADRSARLLALAAAIDERRPALAAALETDTGRRYIAGLEIDGAIASLRGWVGAAAHLLPEGWTQGRSNPAIRHSPHFVPLGVVGVISPWNFPLTLSMIDTIPALLAGCGVVLKPSEVTPRFAGPLFECIAAAGLADIFQITPGNGSVGAALCQSADAICFTGSVATGRNVALACAERLIPAFLELGGKDPLIVLAGSDLEAATDAALRGSVLSTGQACQSIERIYVARPLFADFVARLTAKAHAARLNWPDITCGEIGPIIFERQAHVLADQLADARAKGARVLSGGEIETHGGGLWLRPTVVIEVDHTMTLMTDETFGPIMPVMAFDSVDEAVGLANDTVFGLSAAVFGPDLPTAEAVGRRINAGAISLNDAALTSLFHEAEKQSFGVSGLGASRMGASGFQRFFRRKALIAQTGRPAPLSAFSETRG